MPPDQPDDVGAVTAASPSGDAAALDVATLLPRDHVVQFYESDEYLLDVVARYIGAAIRAGDAGLVIARPDRREALDARLRAAGVDVDAASAGGRYRSLDALETLAAIMDDGMPAPEAFERVIGGLVAEAGRRAPRLRVFGEMVALLAAERQYEATIRLEELWNDLQRAHAFALLCAYPMDHAGGARVAELFRSVHAAHSRVLPAESYSALPSSDEQLREVATLQHKARWLEAEIAERRRVEERLRVALATEQSARREAEVALAQRDEFLRAAAHELKTPLTSLGARAQLMLRQIRRDGEIEQGRAVHAVEVISDQAGKLGRLVNQLLNVTRIESGRLALEPAPADVAALVRQTVAWARDCADPPGIVVAAPGALEALVDPLRLEQVLVNLLDNAVRHGRGEQAIEVSVDTPAPGVVEIAVHDFGVGIAPADRERIFERFAQAGTASLRNGLGLGLYVSRQIVELHGGELRAEFPPAGGSRFVVRLPRDGRDAGRGDGGS